MSLEIEVSLDELGRESLYNSGTGKFCLMGHVGKALGVDMALMDGGDLFKRGFIGSNAELAMLEMQMFDEVPIPEGIPYQGVPERQSAIAAINDVLLGEVEQNKITKVEAVTKMQRLLDSLVTPKLRFIIKP